MRRPPTLLAALALAASGLGAGADALAAPAYRSMMSVEDLLRAFLPPPIPSDNPYVKGGYILDKERAHGYMDGVRDASEGIQWCYTGYLHHEINSDIIAALMKVPPAQRKASARPLIVKVLREMFPCPPFR